jgi:uncharacterized protein with FMN-binding domain
MRRVILAVTATIAGLVALLSFKSHEPSSVAVSSTAGTGAGSGSPSTGAGSPAAAASTGSSPAAGTTAKGDRAIDGNVANTVYGPVQVQVLVKNSKIVGVNILEQPSSTTHDLQLGQMAFPQLISETLAAQSAHVDQVSGATYTSGGYIQSLQSALDNGAL